MAISPPSDLVSDVLRAADPQRAKLARAKLADARGAGVIERGEPGASRVRDLKSDLVFDVVRAADPARARAGVQKLMASSSTPQTKPYEQLEAFLLGQMMETMLPPVEGGAFGEGTAGGVWRSMLASELGTSLASTGGVGIAGLLADGEGNERSGAVANDIVPMQGWPYFRFNMRLS